MAEELTEEQVAEYRECFSLFDKNKDYKIDASEMGFVMRALGQNPTEAELEVMIAENDLDANGTIDFSEFCHLMAKRLNSPGDPKEELRAAFRIFDRNNDGFVVAKELKYVMKKIGEKLTDEEVDLMIREADTNNDGKICYEEFVNLMCTK
ncbi:uncharacterized protein LOC144442349 [Glandiceps talaboti]